MSTSETERIIAQLRDKIEDLQQQVRDLKGERHVLPAPVAAVLSEREATLFRVLAARPGVVSHGALYTAVYGTRAQDVYLREIVSIVRFIRAKLRPLGITIQTRHGYGYGLTDEGRAALRALEAAT